MKLLFIIMTFICLAESIVILYLAQSNLKAVRRMRNVTLR